MKYKARINYDAIPSENYKYVVEINNINSEAVDFISVNDDSEETVNNELINFYKDLTTILTTNK